MGLDNYLLYPCRAGETAPEVEGVDDIQLCGGMMSGHGNDGSFRGKVYSGFVEACSEWSLYEEQPSHVVVEMADGIKERIDEYLKDKPDLKSEDVVFDQGNYSVTLGEAKDLERMFRAFGEKGFTLYAWY